MLRGIFSNVSRLFKEHYVLLPVLTFCLVLIGVENWQRLRYACLHAIDFSIYQQAMYDFFAQKTLNPWLTIRNIAFFNDHFDPIVLFAGLFVNIWPRPESMIIFEYSFLVISVIVIIFLAKKEKFDEKFVILILVTLIMNKQTLSAYGYPVHPSTWSLLPVIFLCYGIYKSDLKIILISSAIVVLYKELFCFALISLGMYYLFRKKYRFSVALITLGLAFAIIAHIVRPALLGPVESYAKNIVNPFVENPIQFIVEKAKRFDLVGFIEMTYPFAFLAIAAAYLKKSLSINFKRLFESAGMGMFFYLSPIFLIHAIAGRFDMQHGMLIIPSLVMMVFASENCRNLSKSKIVFNIACILFFLQAGKDIAGSSKFVFFQKSGRCEISTEKLTELQELKSFVNKNRNDSFMVMGGLIPNLLQPGMKMYVMGAYSDHVKDFKYLVMDKTYSTDIYPLDRLTVQRYIDSCRKSRARIMFENQRYIVFQQNSQRCY